MCKRFNVRGLDGGLVGADAEAIVGNVPMPCIQNDPRCAAILFVDSARDAFVVRVHGAGGFIGETLRLLVHQNAIGENKHCRLGDARARVHRLGVIAAKISSGRGAGGQTHANTVAPVVITAAANRP